MAPSGFVDTGYACRPDFENVVLRSPPSGIITVGGCRLVQRELEALAGRADDGTASIEVCRNNPRSRPSFFRSAKASRRCARSGS